MSTNYLTWLISLSSGAYIEKHGLFVPAPGFFKISAPVGTSSDLLGSAVISITGLRPLSVLRQSYTPADIWAGAPYLKHWLDRNTRRPR